MYLASYCDSVSCWFLRDTPVFQLTTGIAALLQPPPQEESINQQAPKPSTSERTPSQYSTGHRSSCSRNVSLSSWSSSPYTAPTRLQLRARRRHCCFSLTPCRPLLFTLSDACCLTTLDIGLFPITHSSNGPHISRAVYISFTNLVTVTSRVHAHNRCHV